MLNSVINSFRISNIFVLALFVIYPVFGHAMDVEGAWCENGGPYICYPPIDNKSPTYTCTEGTNITESSGNTLAFITNQTIHFYTDGFKNGNTQSIVLKKIFKRVPNVTTIIYEHKENNPQEKQYRKLVLKNNELEMSYRYGSLSTENPAVNGKINYQRCNHDPKKKTFYTALVDCGGSGDYIAGVPGVVNNPLLWDLGDKSVSKNSCQVAARCWGGGWVAFAYSKEWPSDKAAFGAACGSKNRKEAKQQAINSCRESGGTNCLHNVVSGFDDGSNDLDDSTHKGAKVENCSNGKCEVVSSR